MMKWIRTTFVLFFCSFFACQMVSSDAYVRGVQKYRYTRDSFFKFSPQSPLPPKEGMRFIKLNYFDVDTNYHVKAQLVKLETPEPITIQMSGGVSEQYVKIGVLNFKLKGKPYQLAVYQSADFLHSGIHQDELFLPFYDKTNGVTTYPGGRFIDISYDGSNTVDLDFNYAYNPSCAYNHDYSCPLPPTENRLPIEINAGEKLYGDKFRFF